MALLPLPGPLSLYLRPSFSFHFLLVPPVHGGTGDLRQIPRHAVTGCLREVLGRKEQCGDGLSPDVCVTLTALS